MSLVKPITLKSGQFELIQAGDTIDDILNIQSIATTASPTFTGLTLSGLVAAGIVYTDTGGLLTVNTAKFSVDATNVRLGIRIASPAAILHVIGIGGVMTAIFGEHLTDVTSKITRIGATHYTNAEEPMAVLMLQVTATDNFIQYGGGTAAMNAATRHIWYTGANNTTVTGTERMRMDILGRLLLGTTTSNAHLYIVQPVATSGTPVPIFRTDGALHTTLANTEAIDVNFNLARTVQFAGSVTLATQRAFVIQAPTYSSDTPTKTLTTAATWAISGAPIAGTNVTITNPYALWVQAGNVVMNGGLAVGADATGISSLSSTVLLAVRQNQNNSTKMVITNLTVGTSALSGMVLSANATDFFINVYSSAHSTQPSLIEFVASTASEFRIKQLANNPMTFYTNNLERIRITADGKIGFNTTSPDQNFDSRNEINIFGSSASAARLRLRGFYTASPSNPPTDQCDIVIVDNGVSPVLRVRYNDGGVMKVGDLALV